MMSMVGWARQEASEAQAIVAALGLDWATVQRDVLSLERRHLVQAAGPYRFVAPDALANYAFVGAVRAHPERILALREAAGEMGALRRFQHRLQCAFALPFGQELARSEIGRCFERVEDLQDADIVATWAFYSEANPARAARRARQALSSTSVDFRNPLDRLARGASRQQIARLVRSKTVSALPAAAAAPAPAAPG